MDTRFRSLETDRLCPGDEPVSWQVAGTEERMRLAGEIREEEEEQLSVFRALEISNTMQRGAAKSLPIEAEHFMHFGGSWHGHCKTNVCMRTAFNNVNESRVSKAGTGFVKARTNSRLL